MAFKGYRPRSAEDLEKRAEGGGDFLGVLKPEYKYWTPAVGSNWIRILPPTWDNATHYGIDIWQHYSVGPNNTPVLCPAKSKNQRCPVCEDRTTANRPRGKERDPLMPTRRVAVWMLDMNDLDKGPMIWTMAQTVDRKIVKASRDPETGETYYIDHPYEGYNVSFDKVEKGGDAKFADYDTFVISRKTSSVDQKFLDYIEDHPVPDTLLWLDYDAIKALYEGGAPAEAKPAAEPRASADRNGWGGNREAPRSDPPPPRDENDYGKGREPDPEPAKPGPRPSMGGGGAEAPEKPAAQPASGTSSLRDRLKARQAGNLG